MSTQRNLTELWQQQLTNPERPALITDAATCTVADIEQLSQTIGAQLDGLDPGLGVALHTARGPLTIAAVLAIARRKLVAIPLDAAWPPRMCERVLAQCRPAVCLDRDGKAAKASIEEGPTTYPHGCLFVIHTSGSTGLAKPVLISEAALLHRLHWFWTIDRDTANRTYLIHKSPNLIAAAPEYFQGLLNGDLSVVLPEASTDPASRYRVLAEHRVTHCFATPTWWRVMAPSFASHGPLEGLTLATCSAEPMSGNLAEDLHAWLPNARLLNLYGSTECSSNAACFEVGATSFGSEQVPIGRAIEGNSLHVLDREGKALTQGVGELAISGKCLAMGYLGDSTAHAFTTLSGTRTLRTGDLAQYNSDGDIVLVSRADNVFNYRGRRVAPEPIEAALERSEPVAKAAVGLSTPIHGPERLIAIVELEPGQNIDAARQSAEQALPHYLMPRMISGTVPTRSTSAKVDRIQLARHLQRVPGFLAEDAPVSAAHLLTLLIQYIGASDSDINVPFAHAGGDSLTLLEVITGVEARYGVHIDHQAAYEAISIQVLADRLWAHCQLGSIQQSAGVASSVHDYPLTATQRSLLSEELLSERRPSHLVFAYDLPDDVDESHLKQACLQALDAHPNLQVKHDGNTALRGLSSGSAWLEGTPYEALQGRLSSLPLDPATGANLVAGITEHGTGKRVFYFAVHHWVFDGWSRAAFLRSISDAYLGADLEPEFQFATLAHAQVPEEARTQAQYYWANHLKQAPHSSTLPPAVQGTHTEHDGYLRTHLSQTSVQALAAMCTDRGMSLPTGLLAAFAICLSAHCDQTDLVIGVPFSGRRSTADHHGVGCFMRVLPVRLSVDCQSSDAFLASVNRSVLGGLAHSTYPLSDIVADARAAGRTADRPLFDTIFNVFERRWSEFRLGRSKLSEHHLNKPWSPAPAYFAVRTDTAATELGVQYYADRYTEQTMQTFCDHLEQTIQGLVHNDDPTVLRKGLRQRIEKAQTERMTAGRSSRLAKLKRAAR